jgi:hypothetical protein
MPVKIKFYNFKPANTIRIASTGRIIEELDVGSTINFDLVKRPQRVRIVSYVPDTFADI